MGTPSTPRFPSSDVDNGVAVDGEQMQTAKSINNEIHTYLLDRVPIYRELTDLRQQQWDSKSAEEYFRMQRRRADSQTKDQNLYYFRLMIKIGKEIHDGTDVFRIETPYQKPPSILDMCMAPGAFLMVAMEHNPTAHARAFTLPTRHGYQIIIPSNKNITTKYMDITMLAADMGVSDIPPSHPDAGKFLAREFSPDDAYDLAICDGQVLRTHGRAEYRENREASRLTLTQLVIALEHVKPGGTILFLLHKIESWKPLVTLRSFSKFSDVQIYKPKLSHRYRSSCYLVASNIDPKHEEAIRTIQVSKELWKVATFGTDEEYQRSWITLMPSVQEVLEDFGPKFVELGTPVWKIQADALQHPPWARRQSLR